MNIAVHEEETLGKVYDLRLLRRLWPIVRPYRSQVALTLLLVLPMYVLELAPAWIVKAGLDRISGASAASGAVLTRLLTAPAGVPQLLWLAALYFAAMVGAAALSFYQSMLMATTGQSAMRDLRAQIFRHAQRLHLGFFDRYPVGRLVTRATNDVENVAEMFSEGIVAFIADVVKMAGFAAALFLVDARLACIAMVVVPVLAFAASRFRWKAREAFRAVRVRIARINAHIQETISGIKVVQLFAQEARNARAFDALNRSHCDAWIESIRYEALLFATVEAASGLTVALIIGYGTGFAAAGTLYVFIDWTRRFFMPLRDLSAKYSVMQSSMASCERIFQFLGAEPAIRDPDPALRLPAPRARAAVEFENVWFAYQGEDWVLRDVSFRVEPGEKVAIVGATGAGKTSVIKLLNRFYEASRGRVLFDGVDVRDWPQAELRHRIATVLQDVYLFSGSVEDNISLGRKALDPDGVHRAARAVEADAFIRRLPAGYRTEVRERGNNFSAGQRQLLSFARALAHGADVLVLDEATSSIDPETELLVQRGVRTLMDGRTALVIAHRLSTIEGADRIYVFRKGRIAEEGTHQELLAREGLYRRLYLFQYRAQAHYPRPLAEIRPSERAATPRR